MIEVKNLSFAYGDGKKALDGINLKIKKGEFVLITGGSGSGKTTLMRCLNGIVPGFYNGSLEGSIFVDKIDVRKSSTKELAKKIGFVFQDPESMFVTEDGEGEVSFGPRCLGWSKKKTERSVNSALKTLGIEDLRKRSLHELSGGEKQRVAIAAVLACDPEILILDEPLSEIDHETADSLMGFLKGLNENGKTMIIIEQRTERVYDFVNREIVLDSGKIVYDGPPKSNGAAPKCTPSKPGEILARLGNVSFSYGDKNKAKKVLENFSEDFREGELVVLEGPNGSGKTTLLKLMMGLLKHESGIINIGGLENPSVEELAGEVGYVFQNPDNHLFAETVEEEINFILKNTGRKGDVEKILKDFKISQYKKSYPRYLSGGEKQRVALASIIVAQPRILLLDEPTRGMDHELKKELVEFLSDYVKRGNLVIMATHDDFMKGCATRRIVL